ncbi:MAG: Uma2 family endonuclease [Anaerolineae bacterium]|nr:Uma2 family endonuclease [Anaerolineae bacterium]NUQ04999.1 Uma2 family endonuclease [Anaerolineae bacterium]
MTTRDRVITTEEFETFIARETHHERRFELINGEIVEKTMPTEEHGAIAMIVGGEFYLYFRGTPIGRVVAEGLYRPSGDKRNARMPDIGVVLGDRPLTTQGTADFIPDICIEIHSPGDRLKQAREKMQFYLAHGAKFALLLRPRRRVVELYPAEGDYEFLTAEDMLTFGDLLPGFAVPVASLFPA